MGKILRVFYDADLRCYHDGLAERAKKEGVDVKNLKAGEYAVFINSKRDRIKVFAAENVIAYQKSEHGRLDLNALKRIPEVFESRGGFSYTKAVEKELIERLPERIRRDV